MRSIYTHVGLSLGMSWNNFVCIVNNLLKQKKLLLQFTAWHMQFIGLSSFGLPTATAFATSAVTVPVWGLKPLDSTK
jgi:hypothetical protein